VKKTIKLFISVFFLFLALMATFSLSAIAFAETVVTMSEKKQDSADIEVFVRNGCPHCAKAELYLQTLKQEQPSLKIIIRDVVQEPAALERLQHLAKNQETGTARVPAFNVGGQLIVGYSDEITTGQLIRNALALDEAQIQSQTQKSQDSSGSCGEEKYLSCEAKTKAPIKTEQAFAIDFLGYRLRLDQIGLPLFTLAMGLLDGFGEHAKPGEVVRATLLR
jgi:glutaredoxin